MALKYLPSAWQTDLASNYNSSLNFYLNPRCRYFPALTSTGISYIKNDATANLRGTYRMQCGASTSLTYLYTLPQRFIIEGLFKPEFAYNVAANQVIFAAETATEFSIIYSAANDRFEMIQSPGTTLYTSTFTSSTDLQKWIYLRAFYDVTDNLAGFFVKPLSGAAISNSQNTPGSGAFTPGNTISFFPTVAAESSCWIIHELDEALPTGAYITYRADRQIMFDFNGTALGRERIYIPRRSDAADMRGVKAIGSLHYAVENDGGSPCANSATLTLFNAKGQFSDDQYDSFNPFQGYYNGTEKYLQNRVPVEVETCSQRFAWLAPRTDGLVGAWLGNEVPAIPDNAAGTTYVQDAWATVDGFSAIYGCTLSVSGGALVATGNGSTAYFGVQKSSIAWNGKTLKLKIPYDPDLQYVRYYNGSGVVAMAGCRIGNNIIYQAEIAATGTNPQIILYYASAAIAGTKSVPIDWMYIGSGVCTTPDPDASANGKHGTLYGVTPGDYGRYFDGINDEETLAGDIPVGSFTIHLRCKIPAPSAVAQCLISKDNVSTSRSLFLYAVATTGYLGLDFSSDGSTMTALSTTKAIADNALHSIDLVFTASTSIVLAVDGTTVATLSTGVPAALYASTELLRLGHRNSASYPRWLAGSIAEVLLYTRALSAPEIRGLSLGLLPTLPFSLDDWQEEQITMGNFTEPLIIGRTTPGAFARSSPNAEYGEVTIEVEDYVAELGETKLERGHGFTTNDLCDPANESDSLVHNFTRLVTQKTIKNYALNSGFENATIANSWTASGLTLTRDSTYKQFGSYAAKAVAGAADQYYRQVITFEGTDRIDVGDVFNFSVFIRQASGASVKIMIEELDTGGTLLGTASSTTCGSDTGVFTRVDVTRTILSSSCTRLRITVYSLAASTFYADGVMLVRGIDPIDYYLLNSADGSSGSGSADSAASTVYDSIAIDADAVDIEHPYALVKKGETVWDHLKKISSGSLGYYLGMTPDGVFRFANRYAEAGTSTPANLGSITDADIVSSSTSLEGAQANAIIVKGYTIATEALTQLYSGEQDANLTKNSSGKLMHPIASGAAMSVKGATEFEAAYSDAEDNK